MLCCIMLVHTIYVRFTARFMNTVCEPRSNVLVPFPITAHSHHSPSYILRHDVTCVHIHNALYGCDVPPKVLRHSVVQLCTHGTPPTRIILLYACCVGVTLSLMLTYATNEVLNLERHFLQTRVVTPRLKTRPSRIGSWAHTRG